MKPVQLSNLALADLCQQLRLLLQAGVGMGDGLHLLSEQEQDAPLKEMLSRLGRQVEMGEPLSAALVEEGCFPAYFTGLVEVGERTGRTEQALAALSGYYQQRQELAQQVKNALTYPAILLGLMLTVILVLLTKVLPVFEEIYASLGGQLTGLAGGLALLGRALGASLPLLCVVLCALGVGALALYGNASLRARALALWRCRWGDRGVARQFNNARFAQALSLGLSSGLVLEEAAQLACGLLKDIPGARNRAKSCCDALEQGESLASSLDTSELMPPAAARLLVLGMRGGSGDEVMAQLAQRLDGEARQALEDRVAQIEPALVLCTSVLVGAILLSVMLPLMNIMTAVG